MPNKIMEIISKELMLKAAKLSSEWNNTGFIVLGESGNLEATVWNHLKYEDPQPAVIATVNGNNGFVIEKEGYKFEVDPSEIIN